MTREEAKRVKVGDILKEYEFGALYRIDVIESHRGMVYFHGKMLGQNNRGLNSKRQLWEFPTKEELDDASLMDFSQL